MFKTLKKIIKGTLITGAAASATYVATSKLAFNEIFKPEKSTKFINAPWLDDETRGKIALKNEEDNEWYEKQNKQVFSIKTYDGLNLAAEIIFATKHQKFVIIAHPYNSDRYHTLRAAREFCNKGFNVVWYDQRSCGKSEGEYNSMGWYEHLDLLKIVDTISERYKDSKIILYGISMGGACVYKAMADTLPENVKATIIEAGFTSMTSVIKKQIKRKSKVDISYILNGINLFTESILGFSMKDFDCQDDLNNSKCAMMLIHSKDDTMVEYNDSLTAYISYNGPKKLVAFENGCHGALAYQETYFKNIFEFIDKYL